MNTAIDLAPARTGGLRLRWPVIVAAGGAGFGAELLEAVGEATPGAVVTCSVTRTADRGHPPPRMALRRDALLHSVGYPNPGLEAVLRRQAPRWAGSPVPVIVSLCADSAEDIAAMAGTLEMQPDIAGLELNLACPDRGRGGEPIGLDVEASETATVAARAATELPLIVKLSPLAPDIRAVARAVAAAGADAISAIGPLPALALEDDRGRALLGTAYGGLSGPALKPVGLRVTYEIAQVVKVPVIGIGGVSSLEDVLDYLAAGASAVGLASAALGDPALPGALGRALEHWCDEHGLGLRDLIGRALPRRRDRGSLRASRLRR
ncbi:MAG: dihydroorotate dehydrogenase [Chloroflexota bacterium]|jgi:dihydroorotate dehydrogenase (NAD+) catalytic subunit